VWNPSRASTKLLSAVVGDAEWDGSGDGSCRFESEFDGVEASDAARALK
jgi:hypothetical protein